MADTKNLEKRFYFFVPYNLSPIQQAIQAGHAALEYAHKFGTHGDYIDFIENWKTWIILNGGTTNSSRDFGGVAQGSLNQLADSISDFNGHCKEGEEINMAYFEEPDLNNALTAVCFIADERVFNYENYPDFSQWIITQEIVNEDEKFASFVSLEGKDREDLKKLFPSMYPLWVNHMGGEQNLFLRELIKGKKLA